MMREAIPSPFRAPGNMTLALGARGLGSDGVPSVSVWEFESPHLELAPNCNISPEEEATMTVDDLTERLKHAPGKSTVFYYANGVNIEIVTEWREGEQPMRRVIAVLNSALAIGGPLQ